MNTVRVPSHPERPLELVDAVALCVVWLQSMEMQKKELAAGVSLHPARSRKVCNETIQVSM